jgi:hypothetical protein
LIAPSIHHSQTVPKWMDANGVEVHSMKQEAFVMIPTSVIVVGVMIQHVTTMESFKYATNNNIVVCPPGDAVMEALQRVVRMNAVVVQ